MLYDDLTPEKWLKRLGDAHRQEVGDLERLDDHYEGSQELAYMAPELLAELGDRLRQVIVAWPQLTIDAVEERLNIDGFRLPGESTADAEMLSIWQYNDLDEGSSQGHIDAMVMRRFYGIAGENDAADDDTPIITIESPLEVFAERDPRTRKIRAAAKWWCEEPEERDKVEHATLYLPNDTSFWRRESGVWVPDTELDVIDHGYGVPPVEEFTNRPRLARRRTRPFWGVSDLAPILPLSDAACKIATDMMTSAEFHATPRRYVLGADEGDFQDAQGRPVSALQRAIGRVWAFTRGKQDGTEVGQFPEADLRNFHETIKLLAQMVASIAGLPPTYLGIATDNPASADAIRAAEARLITRAERKQRAFGGSWERLMRLALMVREGSAAAVPDDAKRMETLWRDASTPTEAQAADAATKKYQAGIVPLRQTREDLRYTPVQIERMEAEDEKAADRILGPTGDLVGATAKVPAQGVAPAAETASPAATAAPAQE